MDRATGIDLVDGTNIAIGKTMAGDTAVYTIDATSGAHVIEDEGTPLTQRANLDFQGTGVTVTDDSGNDATVVTIPGSAGGGSTRYFNKPAGNITRAATTVGAFSTAWQITGVVVASGENVVLEVTAACSRNAANDFLFALFRGSTQIAAAILANFGSTIIQPVNMRWIDENPGAGTYTYEVRAAMFTSGTLTVYQSNISTDTAGGSSIFTAEVYTP